MSIICWNYELYKIFGTTHICVHAINYNLANPLLIFTALGDRSQELQKLICSMDEDFRAPIRLIHAIDQYYYPVLLSFTGKLD